MTEATLVIIQTVHTRWTKKSRGQPLAARRNATPEVMDLGARPPADAPGKAVVWHDVVCDESHQFAPRETYTVRDVLPGQYHWNELSADLGGVSVGLFGRTCFVVGPGETAAVLYNLAEDVLSDGWRTTCCHKISFHIGVAARWYPRLFHRAPQHLLRSLRDLA
jgi:hypothetical protein